MATKPETNLVKVIQKAVASFASINRVAHKSLKIHGSQYMEAGTPDLLFCYNVNGRTVVYMVEVKLPGREPEAVQVQRLQEWANAGMHTAVVRSRSGIYDLLEKTLQRVIVSDKDYGHYHGIFD